jgi:hypothetical protein
MNARVLLLVFLAASATFVRAQDARLTPVATALSKAGTSWNTNSWLWKDLFLGRTNPPVLRLGRSDFTLSGPLIAGFGSSSASASDRSLAQKILSFPVVRMLVPLPMAPPPASSGRYFAWGGEDRRPWTSVASGAPAESFTSPDMYNAQPQNNLITVGW